MRRTSYFQQIARASIAAEPLRSPRRIPWHALPELSKRAPGISPPPSARSATIRTASSEAVTPPAEPSPISQPLGLPPVGAPATEPLSHNRPPDLIAAVEPKAGAMTMRPQAPVSTKPPDLGTFSSRRDAASGDVIPRRTLLSRQDPILSETVLRESVLSESVIETGDPAHTVAVGGLGPKPTKSRNAPLVAPKSPAVENPPPAKSVPERPRQVVLSPPDPPPLPPRPAGPATPPGSSIQIGCVEVYVERPVAPPPAIVSRPLSAPRPPLTRGFSAWGLRQS